ncbi:MAG: hypothetical protein F2793_10050 [Actinobacteria bacterium]|uniref:Unannotated protein n=1 Tax=freshwater metagenome TaxID=449393 RepID=A0A6J7EZZ3_9ZZZZ|nr:hypothetical protein [Actinomycetota bacterium]
MVALAAHGVTPTEAATLAGEAVTPQLIDLDRGPIVVLAPDARSAFRAQLDHTVTCAKASPQFLNEYGRQVSPAKLVATARRSVEIIGADLLLGT